MKWIAAMMVFCLTVSATPAVAKPLTRHDKELQERLVMMEDQLAALQLKLDEALAAKNQPATPPAMKSKFDVNWYGYIKWDANWDSNRVSTGNYARWVLPDRLSGKDAAFSTTARQTRFGFDIKGADSFGGAKTSAKIEADFYGAGGANEAKPNMRLRQAWMQMNWQDQDLKLRAGNAYDIVAPLLPTTVDFVVRWWAGNPGTRHPIIYLTKGFDLSREHRWEVSLGASRTQGDANALINNDSGQESGQPTFQGHLGYSFPGFNKLKSSIGVSALAGNEEYDINAATNASVNLKTRGTFIDLLLPLTRRLVLSGEYFTGKNLDDYTAGIGQGMVISQTTAAGVAAANTINTLGAATNIATGAQELETQGGWLQLAYNLPGPWKCILGYSIDHVLNNTTIALPGSARLENRSAWGSAWYDINATTQFAVEYSRWYTDYNVGQDGNANRLNSSLIFKF